jgi:hypothetical protein
MQHIDLKGMRKERARTSEREYERRKDEKNVFHQLGISSLAPHTLPSLE